MRDTTHWRQQVDGARAELLAAWAELPVNHERAALANMELRRLMAEQKEKSVAEIMNSVRIHRTNTEGLKQPRKRVDTYPSADVVAAAWVAACRETGANPLLLMERPTDYGARVDLSRARAYAALALSELFKNHCGNPALARLVDAGSPSVYIAQIEFQVKDAQLKWWDRESYAAVLAAIKVQLEREPDGIT